MERLDGIFNYSSSTSYRTSQDLLQRLGLILIKFKEQHPSFDRCCSEKYKLDWDTPNIQKSDVSFFMSLNYYKQ